MKEFFTSHDFNVGLVSGLVSGLVLSGLIWVYQWISRKIRVIRVVFPDITQNQIGIINVSIWEISNVEVKGQISYLHNTIRNRSTFFIEEEKSYISPEPMNRLSLLNYYKYHFLRKDLMKDLGIQPRKLTIDLTKVVLHPDTHLENFTDLETWKNDQNNNIKQVTLNVYVYYYGKITKILKFRKEEIPLFVDV